MDFHYIPVMYRVPIVPPPSITYSGISDSYRRKYAQALIVALPWFCGIAVALILRCGFYGDSRLVVGPNSSRLMQTSSVFVEQVLVKSEKDKHKILLYEFKERPELSLETNWTVSSSLYVDSYGREGFSIWLNKGSRICMHWNVNGRPGKHEEVLVILIKGERKLEEFQTLHYTSINSVTTDIKDGGKMAKYEIPDDDNYYFCLVNATPWSTVINIEVNITSKIYDTSKASSICSTSSGPCKLDLTFPWTHYYVLTTADSEVAINVWDVQISFVARLIIYIVITGALVVVIYLILKNLGACDSERGTNQDQVATQTETDPILPSKGQTCSYGTVEEPESSCSSSEELYDGKMCAICYDEQRNCFFIPCGHSATCFTCAQRIMGEESKVCPICRRLIHKVRRLFTS